MSTLITTRWSFEAFVRATGIGDPLVNDPCWEYDKEIRLAMSEEEKANCPCLGASIFRDCATIPGILSEDFYDVDAQAALAGVEPVKPINPTRIPSPTPIPSPSPFPSPTAYPTPTKLPTPAAGMDLDTYLEDVSDQNDGHYARRSFQLKIYQQKIKEIAGDWADDLSEQMELYAEESTNQFETYAGDMGVYGDELAEWEKDRQSAVGAAESILTAIYDDYGRTFHRSVLYRWAMLALLSFIIYIMILIFQKRKDVF